MDNDFELTIAQVIKKYNLLDNPGRSRAFGQHFLSDASLLRKIASCAMPINEDAIIEVGPGPCGLTRAILELSSEKNAIFCIEKDKAFAALHDNILKNADRKNLHFIYQDALKVRLQDITESKITIISNLPYNVGTQILLRWFQDIKPINKMILMFQKEVAERICATVNTKMYGRLSIISQLLCETEKVFDVSNLAFYPPPKVTSSVIKLTPKKSRPSSINISAVEELTQKCFQFRRKTIHTILKNFYKADAKKLLLDCSIEPNYRPENITPEKFLELSEAIKNAKL